MRKVEPVLLLATPDGDLGMVPARKAKREAKKAANETGKPVTVRNPTTDKVVATEKPDDLAIPAALDRTKGKTKEQIDAERDELIARDKRRDEAQRRLLSKTHSKQEETTMQTNTSTAKREAPKATRKAAKPAGRKVRTASKVRNGNGKAKTAKVEHRNDGPSGMAAKVLALASRAQGASRKELIDLTGWEQQAWKWGFENKHNTGWAQRHGYKLTVIERKDGTTAYKVSKR